MLLGRKYILVRNMDELKKACLSNYIVALRVNQSIFLVETRSNLEFALYFRNQQITSFRLFYEVCYRISNLTCPIVLSLVNKLLIIFAITDLYVKAILGRQNETSVAKPQNSRMDNISGVFVLLCNLVDYIFDE